MKHPVGLGIAALALSFAGSALATPVYVLFDPAYSTPVRVDRTVDGGANWYAQDPGQFHFITQPGSPSNIPADFYTFCIEPREFVTPGQTYTYDLVPLEQGTTNIGGMGTTKANLLRELIYRNWSSLAAVNTTVGAALQVAIWEIVRENQQTVGTYNLATGDVRYRNWNDTAVRDLATTMLNGLTGNGPYITNLNALIATNGVQDVLVDPPTATPEPGTFLLSGAALLAMFGFRKRKNQQ